MKRRGSGRLLGKHLLTEEAWGIPRPRHGGAQAGRARAASHTLEALLP